MRVMHHTALVLSLTLAAATGAAESAPEPLTPGAVEALFADLQAPVVLEDVRADLADGGLEIRFTLPEVGAVSVILHEDDAGPVSASSRSRTPSSGTTRTRGYSAGREAS